MEDLKSCHTLNLWQLINHFYLSFQIIPLYCKWFTSLHYYKEFLVEPDFLIEIMKKNGLSLVESDTFNNLFDIYKDYIINCTQFESINETKKFLSKVKNYYNDELSNFHAYSFLSRYYIFQKN